MMIKLSEFFHRAAVHRSLTLLLVAAYALSFAALPAILPVMARQISWRREFVAYTLCSYSIVGVALCVMLATSYRWRPKWLSWVQLLLVLNWVPHAMAVGSWGFAADDTAWID